ncbi:/ / Dihydrolipoyl dehydrogenase / 392578:393957 Reverse [Candidatus Hepatoplasma crinochetorum]|uniref:Dihydrolipoyl dehydrogenase n=1 Tax=Candidatus Hepatoplasma crinochetorum TaxID=295596 RepID=A0A0G7ZMT4_9MOLU|nr:/ / Dihydrolipoyl dehydrogenase / 392578:393957 Reverse [Candidatus Hepatoplasma crinochetorum]
MFDLIILGGGPGGYELAYNASKKGLKTAIIEKSRFGGTCVTVGCIPSKAFLHAEKVFSEAKEGRDIGINLNSITFDQKQLVKYKDQKVAFLTQAAEMKVKRSGAKIYKGFGKIIPSSKAQDFKISIDDKEIIQSKNLVIATGSEILYPPIKGLNKNDVNVIDSTKALALLELPKKLVIMGGGVIGLELGTFFAGIGSEVSIVELASKIAGPFDREISVKLQQELEKNKNIKFLLGHKIIEILKNEAILIDQNDKKINLPFDKILVAAGRKPQIEGFGLEDIKVYIERGAIVTDENLKTNIPGLYAIGDVNGKSMLAHTAYREGEVVLENILGNKIKIDYDKIPSVIYCTPEVGEIGLNEEKARGLGIEIKVKKIPMLYSGRFVIESGNLTGKNFDGLLKIVLKKDTEEIIGISLLGNYSSEIINLASILITRRYNPKYLKDVVFAHPTVGEIIKTAIIE